MKRLLLPSSAFVRAARRMLKKQPAAAAAFQSALELRADDAFHPQLRTHKLKGKLAGFWACAAGYDLRIVFSFVQHEDAAAILLESVGTHEEVY